MPVTTILVKHKSRHDRRSRTRSKELQHEQDQEQGHQARTDCAEVSVSPRIQVQAACRRPTGKAGYCSSQIQGCHLCERMLLALP